MKTRTLKVSVSALKINVVNGEKIIASLLVFQDGNISVLTSDIPKSNVIIRHFGNPTRDLSF